jgi:hypothetical protein
MKDFMSFIILAATSLAVGCAAQPSRTSAPTGAGVAATGSASTATRKSDDIALGYDRVVINGKQLFCRTEPITGTRISHKVCLTQAQLQARQDAARQFIETLQRNAGLGATGYGQMLGPTSGQQ